MRISDWSSDVCSSDLDGLVLHDGRLAEFGNGDAALTRSRDDLVIDVGIVARIDDGGEVIAQQPVEHIEHNDGTSVADMRRVIDRRAADIHGDRSEEHTSELQSLMRISYAVFCLKKK